MKKTLLLTMAAIILAACGDQKSPKSGGAQSSSDGDYVPQRSDYTFRSDVRVLNDEGDVTWDSIIVYLTDAKGQIQELYSQAMPLDTTSWEKGSIGEITEEDWNFDGIPDLQVCMGPMNGFGNYVYDVWLWNDKTHQFDHLNDCPEIFSPEIDAANKCITSDWRLDDEVEIVQYKWKDGKLVETDRKQLSYSEMTED